MVSFLRSNGRQGRERSKRDSSMADIEKLEREIFTFYKILKDGFNQGCQYITGTRHNVRKTYTPRFFARNMIIEKGKDIAAKFPSGE